MPLDGQQNVHSELTRLLFNARGRIADKATWMKGASDMGLYAVRRCSVMALWIEATSWTYYADVGRAKELLDLAATCRGYHGIIHMNDAEETTHEGIMAAWDDAIRLSQKEWSV